MDTMRRALGFRIAAAMALTAFLGLCAAVLLAAPAKADVQDFSYDSWNVRYEIGTDEEGRAVADVTETLTARFPNFDQNRGIVRGLPIEYEGASTHPRDFRVTDETGTAVPFEIEREDGFVAVLVGDDDYVHGVRTYVIEYTLDDVILARDDGSADEFYWDLTDFEHQQPIYSFSAEVLFAPDLATQLNGDARCYSGTARSTDECTIDRSGDGFSVTIPGLTASEGVTVAIGLAPGSVQQPASRLPNFWLDALPGLLGIPAAVLGVAGVFAVGRLRRRRRSDRGVVIAQYDVPADLPPLLAAPIWGQTKNPAAAELVHLAVQGAIRVEEGEPEQGFFGRKAAPVILRLIDPSQAPDQLDRGMLETVFPTGAPDTVFTVPKQSSSFGSKMQRQQSRGLSEAKKRGYFEHRRSPVGSVLGIAGIVLAATGIALSLVGAAQRSGAGPIIGLVAGLFGLVLSIIAVCPHRVHTERGARAREHLAGVKEFIRVAEADRIRMLQSYDGAERFDAGGTSVIHLYERLLPYAMLFGLESEWAKALTVRYQEHPDYQPYWYSAAFLHGARGFESTISQFTSSLNSSVSYSSSSSGGSSGGGFAGGGGGGGFSGGR